MRCKPWQAPNSVWSRVRACLHAVVEQGGGGGHLAKSSPWPPHTGRLWCSAWRASQAAQQQCFEGRWVGFGTADEPCWRPPPSSGARTDWPPAPPAAPGSCDTDRQSSRLSTLNPTQRAAERSIRANGRLHAAALRAAARLRAGRGHPARHLPPRGAARGARQGGALAAELPAEPAATLLVSAVRSELS